jgi:Flp pilus assembly protein TadG
MRGFANLLRRFHDDERGVFAVLFGVFAIVLIATAGAVVDYTSEELARTRAQQALDSAALGLAPTMYDTGVTEDTLKTKAEALVIERLANSSIIVDIDDADADTANGRLTFSGSVTVPMAFLHLIGIPTLTAKIASEATKGSINLEVALSIDITKSMEGDDQIGALETATSELIDLVVKDDQTPTYSKMAVIPWSMGVNVGSLADDVRGEPWPAKAITGAVWAATGTGSSGSISGVTRASPGVITSNNHGLVTGDRIGITGVSGMTQINSKGYRVVRINTNTFSLQTLSSGSTVNTTSGNGYSSYSSGGTWRKCALTTCEVTVTSTAHGFADNDWVVTTDIGGLTGLNNKAWQVKDKTTNTFKLKDSVGVEHGTAYTSGGNAWCSTNVAAQRPCEYYRYLAADNSTYRIPRITDCVTERVTDRYTNATPTTTWLGRHYPDGNSLNNCITNEIIPLTSDRDTLHDDTTGLVAAGSTSGHSGLAWGWYLLSHDFTDDLFASGSESIAADPDAQDAEPVMKVLVLMTDGLFNTSYCNGVVAKNADSVAGSNAQRINCDGVNSTTQGTHLCSDIEADGIIIYTVAFALDEIANDTDRETVRSMLANCATDNGGAYEATDGDDLLEAFRSIGRNISNLRLSK